MVSSGSLRADAREGGEFSPRAAAGWADRALAYLAGDPAVRLDAGEQRDLVRDLVTGRASRDDLQLALQLLWVASDEDLKVIFSSDDDLLRVLHEGVPAGHEFRADLDSFLAERFEGGREELAAGRVLPYGQPGGAFTPALLSDSLAGLPLDRLPRGEEIGRVEEAIRRQSLLALSELLSELPPVERARAARWLAGVRVTLGARGGRPAIMRKLDTALDLLYGAAVAEVPEPEMLRLLTIRPPAAKAGELRAALDPAWRAGEAGGRPQSFTRLISGQGEDFGVRLVGAYRSDIEGLTQRYVEGRRGADRGRGLLLSAQEMGLVAAEAGRWVGGVFGDLVEVPELFPGGGGAGGGWQDADELIWGMSPDEQRAWARNELISYLDWDSAAAWAAREHHAVPVFDEGGVPGNEEARVISGVIGNLLGADTVARVLDISAGRPGRAAPWTGQAWAQVFRAPERWRNQQMRWEYFQAFIREIVRRLEHPDFARYCESLGGTYAGNALYRGAVGQLTTMVWASVPFWEQDVRAAVEGDDAGGEPLPHDGMPRLADREGASMGAVRRLVHVTGDARNLVAAYLLGDVEKIAALGSAAAGPEWSATGPVGDLRGEGGRWLRSGRTGRCTGPGLASSVPGLAM